MHRLLAECSQSVIALQTDYVVEVEDMYTWITEQLTSGRVELTTEPGKYCSLPQQQLWLSYKIPRFLDADALICPSDGPSLILHIVREDVNIDLRYGLVPFMGEIPAV